MPLNLDAIGFRAEPFTVTWTAEDAILYALGVGAGQADPLDELALTTENTTGVDQQVLPTFGVVLAQSGILRRIPIGEFDRSKLLHADQQIEMNGTIPIEGAATVEARLDGIHDKRTGALVVISAHACDAETGKALWTSRLGYFIRDEVGLAGEPAAADWRDPDREPDHLLATPTRPDQALLYRLSGDRNPLHSDPTFAARAGFDRPILHGLCTYGVVHRALLGTLCDGDTSRIDGMYARFSRPVLPGEKLRTAIWRDDNGARFRTIDGAGRTVLDRGRFDFR
ncbi:3-alpha,7-alpha,12-alpha-trihydroxy-5-beta-cholest-24-enoyl-CoA hydratase [Rhodococcus oxybenzonivorans]|uniref:3-alpha,7-alpha, 12-alpha-trihydroxy-5-beta-cholest-24-enoyl-CoA hydratase n=1 Tax=Rhodococcus oxybenzonivorans TaxID=1990687 RepID=A0A2S2BZC4_9NOCA|nr:MaoC/PaaZ C-terminal domain-containing protein [Rhodococcus oxybenzonivorans]AWK73914.1 3-alpha,7-alpha,12-alpha-trihydroxy-5-beta-cholest-24-enoyl-CoA hydratase [Rhodococcus oxybenzonivorans]